MGTDRSVHAALGVVSDFVRNRGRLGTEWSVPILSQVYRCLWDAKAGWKHAGRRKGFTAAIYRARFTR